MNSPVLGVCHKHGLQKLAPVVLFANHLQKMNVSSVRNPKLTFLEDGSPERVPRLIKRA
jgi:hypothetical protein